MGDNEPNQDAIEAAISTLVRAGYTVEPPSTGVDTEFLKAIIANAEWTARPDYGHNIDGTIVEVAWDDHLADALGWECGSCRPDVGWAAWNRLERKDGVVTLHIECGHCGADYHYDAEGNELED